jgi:hypothetical protein
LDFKIAIRDITYGREIVQDKGSTVLWKLHPEKTN